MAENENPHGSSSHHFSPVAKDTAAATGSSSDFSSQWTPFSGISSQADPAPLKTLCSWNPMDLPDFTPLSKPLKVNSSHSNSRLTDFGVFNGSSDFLNHSQTQYHRQYASSQKFQTTDSVPGKFTYGPSNRMQSCSFDHQSKSNLQHDYQQSNCASSYDDVNLGCHIHQQSAHPPFHKAFVGLDTSDTNSVLSSLNSSVPLKMSVTEENVLAEDGSSASGRLASDISVENWSPVHFMHTPHTFWQSSAYPFSAHKKQNRDQGDSPDISSCFLKTVDGLTTSKQTPDKLSVKLNAGVKSDRSELGYSNVINTNTDECKPYTAKKPWNFVSCNKILTSDNISTNQNHPVRHEVFSEAASSADLFKPSYSTVAKTPKRGSPFGANFDHSNSEASARNTLPKMLIKDDKQFQPMEKRTESGSKCVLKATQGEEADQPRLVSTSKYGLDSFSDQSVNSKISPENLAKGVYKRGSDSTIADSVDPFDLITSQNITDYVSSEKNGFKEVHEVPSSVQQSSSTNPAKLPMSSKPHSASTQPASKKSAFFDPKRIFQTETKTRVHNPAGNLATSKARGAVKTEIDNLGSAFISDTILNNGKSASSTSSSKLPTSAHQHDYINNDLRDTSKLTNQFVTSETGHGTSSTRADYVNKQKDSRFGKKPVERTVGANPENKRFDANVDRATDNVGAKVQQNKDQSWSGINRRKIEKWCSTPWYMLRHYGNICITTLFKLLIFVLWIIFLIVSGVTDLLVLLFGKLRAFIKRRMPKGGSETKDKKNWSSPDFWMRNVGLEENIDLPATGEEAMRRLLACKGKDPYSILGLRADSSNEDIKKYYRKQAVLVHPDKNQEPGAEEAFKILGHAFEMIGEPEKRKQYDSHTQEANEVEAMREFADMLSKLQTKIQEAANIMPCDHCGGKHRRVPVERPGYAARFCQRCNIRHSAQEGDVWAESSVLGFYWHYFALMDGHVFDITEWMKCHEEYFSHMKANSHLIQYKIATEGNRRNRHHQQGDPNLEDLINQLLKSSATANSRPTWASPSYPGSERPTQGGASEGTAAAAGSAKKSRRKKKHR